MPSTQGLPVSSIINTTIDLAPPASATRNFGGALFLGSSPVIDILERFRSYASIDAVASDFGTNAPEYTAALRFFSQSPRPSNLFIGRWAQQATAGLVHGGALTVAQQAIGPFNAVNAGKLSVTVDGVLKAMVAIDLSACANLPAVAAAITVKLAGVATCTWDAVQQRFDITSATTGVASTLSLAAVVALDQGLGALMRLQAGQGGILVNGALPETLLAAVTTLANMSTDWYFLAIAATGAGAADADMPAIAAYIEAASPSRFVGFTTQDANVLVAAATTDLAYVLKAALYSRSFVQYSSTNPYAVASMIGRAATVDFEGENTTITLKFKVEPGITGELLTSSQYAAAKAKNCNVFTKFNNDTVILQEGITAAGYFVDEIHGTDWLADDIQTALFNALYEAKKVPQTDKGVGLLIAVVNQRCAQAVRNGLAAPGVWDAQGFGALTQGDTLTLGYYTYAPPVSTQSQADRAARVSPVIQTAIKMAGAIHFVSNIINVNR